MAKYGWKKGQGLGATGDGMTTAISVQQAPEAKKKAAAGEKGPVGMAGGATRGTIVSESREARERAEKARFGEPTRSASGLLSSP
jgi:splicing factor 45